MKGKTRKGGARRKGEEREGSTREGGVTGQPESGIDGISKRTDAQRGRRAFARQERGKNMK